MLPSTSQDSCKICGQKAVGNNFGALSCRACAAFFRRNALNPIVLKCEKQSKCKPIGIGKFFCKKCRMDKCRDEGMDEKKFQTNRDVLNTASNFKSSKSRYYEIGVPHSMSTFLGRPSSILCCEPEKASHIKTILDVSPMIRRVERILQSNPLYSISSNSLERLTQHHETMRKSAPNQNMMVAQKIEKSHVLRIWEDAFVDTATWLAHFDEFRALPESVQMMIVKSSWGLWSKMDKLEDTAAHLKQLMISDSVLIIGNDIGIDQKNIDMDVSWMTNYRKEQLEYFQPVDLNNNYANVVMGLMDLEPTKEELNYMFCHLCLHISGKRHNEISSITDRLLELQANNLHNYYQKTQKCSMYSTRIAKMMRINNLLMKDMWEKKERQHLAKVFNLYCFEVSEEAMFEGV